jgi:tRNA uridine 5-carboxymethylaminomethyl modification enzyme
MDRVSKKMIGASKKVQELLTNNQSTPLKTAVSLAELIRRPEMSYEILAPIDEDRPELPEEVTEQVEINIKYEGYIKRQLKQVEQFKKMEEKLIPEDICYEDVNSLRIEAVQKLNAFRPRSIGQASRISGVSPADISVLMIYLGSKAMDTKKKK